MGKKKWTGPNEKRHRHKKRPHNFNKKPFNRNSDPDETSKPHAKKGYQAKEGQSKELISSSWTQKISLFEKDVKITEYAGQTVGFIGVIKARFSDFQVNEIDLDGNVAKLTDLKLPEKCIDKDAENIDESIEQVRKLLSDDVWTKITEIAGAPKKVSIDPVEINVSAMDKEQRSLIHNTVKFVHGPKVIGSTYERNDKKWIKFAKYTAKDARNERIKWLWPHEYVYFVMHKQNLDTMMAANNIAHNLGINVSNVSYAGTKDKRGKTTQWLCVRKREPEKIAKAAEKFTNIHVGNFTFKSNPLKLGLLKGNRFRIALRHLTASQTDVDASMKNFQTNGFINYYGLQRFGNCVAIPTHHVGLALLRGQFKEACELILKPRDNEPEFMKRIREFWWKKRDAAGALKLLFKKNKSVEGNLLAGLAKHGANDYVNALEYVPRNMRLLYIHAYQSLVWNETVSRRIREFGCKLQVGDLVFVDDAKQNVEICDEIIAENNDDDDNKDGVDEDVDAAEKNDEETEKSVVDALTTNDEDSIAEVSRFKSMVRPLTEEDVESGNYSIFDVVLTLPGHDVTYPSNECKYWIEQRLAQDGLTSDKLKLKQKTYSLTGAYRKMLIKPENVSWKFQTYENEVNNLILSDMDELNNVKLDDYPDGKMTALIMDFCLPSSAYATMALREILKADTSKSNQIDINDAAETEVNKMESNETKENDDDATVLIPVIGEKRSAEDDADNESVKKQKLDE